MKWLLAIVLAPVVAFWTWVAAWMGASLVLELLERLRRGLDTD